MSQPAIADIAQPIDTITILECTEERVATKRIRLGPGERGTVTDGYDAGTWFAPSERPINSFDEMATVLGEVCRNPRAFVIRGELQERWRQSETVRRTSQPKPGIGASFVARSRRWLAIDIDKAPQPAGCDPAEDPEGAVEHLIGRLPEEFQDASCWWQWTSGQGFKGDTLNARLWFWLSKPAADMALRRWAEKDGQIDPALYSAVEPHYIAAPILGPGVHDPVPRRYGVRRGLSDEVALELPDVAGGSQVGGWSDWRERAGDDFGGYEHDEVVELLRHIPNPDLPYDKWLSVGVNVKAAAGADGEEAFVGWSSKSGKFNERDARTKFRSLNGNASEHALYLLAREHGHDPFEWRGVVVDLEAFRANGMAKRAKAAAGGNTLALVNPAVVPRTAPFIPPKIQVVAGELHRMTDQAEDALIRGKAPFYARGLFIMKPIADEVPASKGRTTVSAKLVKVNHSGIIDNLSKLSRWQTFDRRRGKGGEWVDVDPPFKVAQILESRVGEWRLPKVAGIITTPTLRRDGSVLDRPGYDPETRLILVSDGRVNLDAMPTNPTRDDALAALGMLTSLIAEFPFVSDADRAVGLSALITPVVRGALSTAPLHAIRAPTPGSGKSFLVDVASIIASGKPCPVLAAGKTEEETEKRLGGAFLEGMPLVSLDNINGELSGDQLCQLIDRPLVKVRPLGVSDLVEIESRATVFATGNNLHISGDLTRRAILCELDAGVERPELKHYATRPDEAVLADRGRYVGAALTIVRAYMAAGQPNRCRDLASFEDWSRLVRSSLVWLGAADPCASMERIREDDPERAATLAVIEHLLGEFGEIQAFTAREAADCACEGGGSGWRRPDMRDALLSVAGDHGAINTRRLGRWMVQRLNRPFDGTKIVKAADGKNGVKFRLIRC